MADLAKKSLSELTGIFGEKTGLEIIRICFKINNNHQYLNKINRNWLHQISKGIDTEPVMSRRAAKSIGCSKNFRGNQVLNTHTKLEYWARNLCEELEERLESDKAMVVIYFICLLCILYLICLIVKRFRINVMQLFWLFTSPTKLDRSLNRPLLQQEDIVRKNSPVRLWKCFKVSTSQRLKING
jgi:nucleotidyltransferase/DNA polymerase involved in DNA repair